jgi:hypothetical protein
MTCMQWLARWAALGLSALLVGCATPPPAYDYTAFRAAKPASILVLPPINSSPDVKATNSVWAQTAAPLGEAGYYVLPIAVVAELFRENGLSNAPEAQQASPAKLREFFGADAALYLNVKQYGTSYQVIGSESRVTVEARLMDLRQNTLLWEGSATASTAEQQQSNNAGLVGLLVKAVVNQIIGTVTNASHPIAGIANSRLLTAGRPAGLLFGPRSPQFGREGAPAR